MPRWAWIIASVVDWTPLDEETLAPTLEWHEVLGVEPTCSISAASRARAQLAKQYHPDAGGNTDAMQRINAAFDAAKWNLKP